MNNLSALCFFEIDCHYIKDIMLQVLLSVPYTSMEHCYDNQIPITTTERHRVQNERTMGGSLSFFKKKKKQEDMGRGGRERERDDDGELVLAAWRQDAD